MSVIAFVEKLNTKAGIGKNGNPYKLYSLKLQDKDGNLLPGYYQCNFDHPGCKDGDYVKLEANPKGDNWEVVKGSVKVSKNPPAKPASPSGTPNANKGGGGGYSAPKAKTSDLFGEIGGYNTEDDIRRMSYSAARTTAVEVVGLLLANDAIKLVKADTKAGAASRFDLITAAVDKLTVEYFYDSATGRKLESVADTGNPDTSGDGALPDTEEEFEEDDEFDNLMAERFDDAEDDDDFE